MNRPGWLLPSPMYKPSGNDTGKLQILSIKELSSQMFYAGPGTARECVFTIEITGVLHTYKTLWPLALVVCIFEEGCHGIATNVILNVESLLFLANYQGRHANITPVFRYLY